MLHLLKQEAAACIEVYKLVTIDLFLFSELDNQHKGNLALILQIHKQQH